MKLKYLNKEINCMLVWASSHFILSPTYYSVPLLPLRNLLPIFLFPSSSYYLLLPDKSFLPPPFFYDGNQPFIKKKY